MILSTMSRLMHIPCGFVTACAKNEVRVNGDRKEDPGSWRCISRLGVFWLWLCLCCVTSSSSAAQPLLWSFRACLVSNKSPTYKSKSEKSDLFCQTDPTYKSPELISHPLLRGSHHLYVKKQGEKVCSGDL